MKAVLYHAFGQAPVLADVPDPSPERHGVVVEVGATGVCRSDWHGWVGHDPDITLPHVPGHELAGVIREVGRDVTRWKVGDRVTVPFVSGCGACPDCHAGHQQVCQRQVQPGFTHWGSFAQAVSIHQADLNLVGLPDDMGFATAASLGCRFATAFRAVVDQARTTAGQWVAVHGCGGVGLSAIMIERALGANVIAIDIKEAALAMARQVGAAATIDATSQPEVAAEVIALTGGGAHVSIDALGHPTTCFNSISCLRSRGRHVQVGLMLDRHSTPAVPMARVIAKELEILGSHGMQAHRYGDMLAMIRSGVLRPDQLISREISLQESIAALTDMDSFAHPGVTVVTRF